jgi:hypothetical protein
MELEPHQYGVLRTYQKWRRHPPTHGSLIMANLKPLAIMTQKKRGNGYRRLRRRAPAFEPPKTLNLPGAFHAPIPGTSIFGTFDEKCISSSDALSRLIYRSALAGKPVCSSKEAADYFLEFVASHRRRH